MTLSLDELLTRARPYWRADDEYSTRHEWSPEDERLRALWKHEGPRLGQAWDDMLAEVREQLPRYRVYDVTHPGDAGFRCTIDPPSRERRSSHRQVVIGCLSLLAPVYIVYGLQYPRSRYRIGSFDKRWLSLDERRLFFDKLTHSMLRPAAVLARRMEARFGVTALPAQLAATPVPLYVDWRVPPHTTLFHALFSSEPDNVP